MIYVALFEGFESSSTPFPTAYAVGYFYSARFTG
jgi:hypothetical protein